MGNEEVTINTKTLEDKLLKTSWIKEAEEVLEFVPHEDLTKTQINVLTKCVEKKDLTENQKKELKKILQKYRAILQKIRPKETVEQYNEAVQMMKSEKDFIELMQSDEHKTLIVHLATDEGNLGFEFEVLPLKDSRVVDALEVNIDLFRDYSLDDINTYNKFVKGEEVTEEEAKIIGQMNKKIIERESAEKIKVMDNFLANQLKLKGNDSPVEERKQFWELFPFNQKTSVFLRVQDKLGMNEQSNLKLFPTG